MYIPAVALVIIPLTVILLFTKGMHKELILGFFFILTLSDSRVDSLAFAATSKNAYIVLLALFFLKEYKKIDFKIPFVRYLIPFLAVAFLCALYSPIVNTSIQKTLSYSLIFLILPNYMSLIVEKSGVQFYKDIVWFVFTLLIFGLVLNFINSDITNLIGRYRGVLGNPNGLGIYVFIFTVMFYVINTLHEGLFSKEESRIIYIVCFLNLYMCGSRNSIVATLLFLFLTVVYKRDRFLGFIMFLIILFTYQLVSENIDNIILSLGLEKFFRIESLEDGSGRLVAWVFAWEHIQENYFFGLGFNYTEYLYKLNYTYLSKLNHQGAAHNAYLTFWLDTGLIGLSTFLFGFIAIFYKLRKITPIVFPILFSVLFSNQFESWLTASLNPFTIQLIIILSIIYYRGFRQDSDTNEVKKIPSLITS